MTKLWFNKQFNEMMSNKQKELGMIEDKNKRLNVIISGEFFLPMPFVTHQMYNLLLVGWYTYCSDPLCNFLNDKLYLYAFLELNMLSSLKGSDDVIDIYIEDPQWAQEEIPSKLITVEEDEVKLQI